MARLLVLLGGILAIVSLLFTWWFSYYSSSSFHSLNPIVSLFGNSSRLINNISSVEEMGSPGIPISDTTFGRNYSHVSFLIPIIIILVALGGILGIASGILNPKHAQYEVGAGIAVLVAVCMFGLLLVYTAGLSLLGGSTTLFGINVVWGVGPGLVIALASAFMMIFARKLKRM